MLFRILPLLIFVSTAWANEPAPTPLTAGDLTNLQQKAEIIRKRIESGPPQFSLIGVIERGRQADFSVNDEDFIVDSTTRINGELRIGVPAHVRGERVGERNYAKKIVIDKERSVRSSRPQLKNRDSDAPFSEDEPDLLPGQPPLKD